MVNSMQDFFDSFRVSFSSGPSVYIDFVVYKSFEVISYLQGFRSKSGNPFTSIVLGLR